ncbi:biotin--[acetyl-CoA-carboxylase] ligase [Candidatus Pelagibacter sp.]|nr:biotin--[acetyl-CoA-carboxylase] ligase [Candidatus Pelagibacter sp.]
MKIKKFNYKIVNSTNDIAINLIMKKNINNGIVLAEKQKKGRGQRGKKWISLKGNFFATVFFKLEKTNLTLKQLTKINVNIISKLISLYYNKRIVIKFPNDILINKKKICGILQETIQKKNITFFLVGIGLNLVKNPNIPSYPTTNLYDLIGYRINIHTFSNQLVILYNKFLNSQKFFK